MGFEASSIQTIFDIMAGLIHLGELEFEANEEVSFVRFALHIEVLVSTYQVSPSATLHPSFAATSSLVVGSPVQVSSKALSPVTLLSVVV